MSRYQFIQSIWYIETELFVLYQSNRSLHYDLPLIGWGAFMAFEEPGLNLNAPAHFSPDWVSPGFIDGSRVPSWFMWISAHNRETKILHPGTLYIVICFSCGEFFINISLKKKINKSNAVPFLWNLAYICFAYIESGVFPSLSLWW